MSSPAGSASDRADALLATLSLAEKAALMFHTVLTIGPEGELLESDARADRPGARELIADRGLTHFNVVGSAPAGAMARWHNLLQDIAAGGTSAIPVTLSSDPRHAFADNPGTAIPAGAFSQWPEPLGIGALRDPETASAWGEAVRREYTAVGIRVALHPQLDLATEPRWARLNGTFGDDAQNVSALGVAYLRALQGDTFGDRSVSAMVKHFPGGGPQKDGEDPHFSYGREQVYPGRNWEEHLAPFRAAIAAGCRQVMPYYGLPVGSPWDEVGFAFNRPVIQDLLRDELGFDGIVCADWGVIHDSVFLGHPFPARAWGVERLSPLERMRLALDAGIDQFGGEACPELIVELVENGSVSPERIDASARRMLREKFALGLFDEKRWVDPDLAEEVVGSRELVAAGRRAQSRAVTVLENRPRAGARPLPVPGGLRLYVHGIDAGVAAGYGDVVEHPSDADLAVIRLASPYEPRGIGTFEEFFHAGRLDFDEDTLSMLHDVSAHAPLVVVIDLERPPILGTIPEIADALVVDYGSSDAALLDALTGKVEPVGALPVGLPLSPEVVAAHASDTRLGPSEVRYASGHRRIEGASTGP